MKTVPFGDILAETCQLIGLDRNVINDKTFGAVRDLCSRRLGSIWDREEWPDADRYLSTYPGTPVTNVTALESIIVTETGEPIVTETGEFILYTTETNEMDVTISLDTDFPRIYLADFASNAYRDGTIGVSKLNIVNGFYVQKDDGTTVDVSEYDYEFTYTTDTDNNGEYITSVTISLPYGLITGVGYGTNGRLTPVITFKGNPQYLVKLPTPISQGLDAWDKDPRLTSRNNPVDFIVEDASIADFGPSYEDVTYLRFANSKKKFIKYRLSAPRLNGIRLIPGSSIQSGTAVYYDVCQSSANYSPSNTSNLGTCGDFWIAQTLVPNGVLPQNGSVYWSRIEIPRRFKDYLVNGTSADFLRSEGRADEAMVLDQLAEAAIQQQIDVYIRQQGQNQRMSMVFTY
jgi:hypothetical protein